MITNNSAIEDARIILGFEDSSELEKLVHELNRFRGNERLNLSQDFFEIFRRNPNRRDLLFQALKERNKKVNDKERKLIESRDYPKEFEKEVDEITKRIKSTDFSDYGVQLYYGQGILTNPKLERDNKTITDAPYQFILIKGIKYCANIGFFPEPGRICVTQIQGFSRCAREIEPLKWSRLLLRAVIDWAEEAGVPEADVLPYKRNGWDKIMYNSNGHSNLIYDVSAKREGFRHDQARELFVKTLGCDEFSQDKIVGVLK